MSWLEELDPIEQQLQCQENKVSDLDQWRNEVLDISLLQEGRSLLYTELYS